jgi:hypothetical protein
MNALRAHMSLHKKMLIWSLKYMLSLAIISV